MRGRFGSSFKSAVGIFVLALAFGKHSWAQNSELSGNVRAVGGIGISGAKVASDCSPATGVTDERGAFSLRGLKAGCMVTATADSFEPGSQKVTEAAGSIEIQLNVDPLRQTVTVMDSSPLVNNNPEISTAIDSRTLSELPSSIRDINRFAMLDPRVRNTGSLGTDGIYGTRLTVNGQLFRFTQYRMDGMSNYEPALGNGPRQVLSIASVAEYKVVVNQFSAEYGRSSAGIISATTRTGGEAWHGEAFYFLRPSGMQAAPPVSIFRVPNERHMWGGAVGGALRPTLRVFASLEGNQQTRGAYIQSPVPSFYAGHQKQWLGLVNIDQRFNDNQSFYLRLNAHSSVGDNANDAVGGFNHRAPLAETPARISVSKVRIVGS